MNRRFALLVGDKDLDPPQRWRLVASLFDQSRSLVEGSCAVVGVQAICLWRTGDSGFLVLALMTLAVTVLRVLQWRRFRRQAAEDERAASVAPEAWAGRFITGMLATSAHWAITELLLFARYDDPLLQLFTLMVHTGWQVGAAARNAASPRAIILQTLATTLPALVWVAMFAHGFVLIMVPFGILQISATLSVARNCGGMLLRAMLSEQRLSEANARLTALSATDALTGIGNRRAFDAALQTAWQQAARDGTDLAVLLLDVDHFKSFNDRYGHPAGDGCLQMIGAVLAGGVRRPQDFPARYGGEEFVVLLPATTEGGARDLGTLLCRLIEEAGLPHLGNPAGHVTVSIGAASMAPAPGEEGTALVALADRALYHAKQSGRRRVCTASEQAGLATMVDDCVAARTSGLATASQP